jgi:hypothetical protein
MKLIISLLITIICAVAIAAQTTSRPRISGNNTSNILLDSARFEIIKWEESTPQSIKLDRYTGKTYLYGIGGGIFNASRKWFLLSVKGGLPAAPTDLLPRYNIYEGSEGLLLLNNETGQSWVLINRTWEPVLD